MKAAWIKAGLFACGWLLAGCGGGQEEVRKYSSTAHIDALHTPPKPTVVVTNFVYRPRKAASGAQGDPAAAAPAQRAAATSDEPSFSIVDELGDPPPSLELESVRGRGYPELKVIARARRIGDISPPEPVRPTCKDDATCEFRLGKVWGVRLESSTHLRLVPRDDGLAIVAKVMRLEIPKAVDLVYTKDEQPWSRKRIVLLSAD